MNVDVKDVDLLVVPALGWGETATLVAPVEWHDRIVALVPRIQYGPNYSRSVWENLSDMSRRCRQGYSTAGYDYLLAAEGAAARIARPIDSTFVRSTDRGGSSS